MLWPIDDDFEIGSKYLQVLTAARESVHEKELKNEISTPSLLLVGRPIRSEKPSFCRSSGDPNFAPNDEQE
jgi:hypothetical protein